MTLTQRISTILRGSKVAGLELRLGAEPTLHAAILTTKKEQLSLAEAHADIALDALTETVKTSLPINLCITGKGLILRQVEYTATDDDYTLLNKVLPNALTEDFYLQAWALNDATALVAVARKPAIDEALQLLTDKGYSITSVVLGPYVLGGVLPLLETAPDGEVELGQHTLQLTNKQFSGYRANPGGNPDQQLSLAGEATRASIACAFAAGLEWFVPGTMNISTLDVGAGQTEYEQKRLFTVGGWSMLVFFLLVLLVNFFVFDTYNTKEQDLSAQVAQNRGTLANITQLEAQVQQKRDFMAQMGILDPSRTSFYSDQIGQTVPNNIQLTELTVNPLEKQRMKGRKELNFQPGVIHVSGRAKRSSELNSWIKDLKNYEWVQSVSILNYTQDNASVSGEFNIAIQL